MPSRLSLLSGARENLRAGRSTNSFSRSSIDQFLGVSSSLSQARSLNLVARGPDDRVRTAADLAGQNLTGLSTQQQSSVQQFLDPTLSAEQDNTVQRIARTAVGQGLFGGRVKGAVDDVQTRFLAQSRANAFGDVANLVSGQLGQIEQRVGGFVGGSLGLQRAADTQGNFNSTARDALGALSSVGLGAEAVTSAARARGITIASPAADTGAGEAFLQFLSPRVDGTGVRAGVAGRFDITAGGGTLFQQRLRQNRISQIRNVASQQLFGAISERLGALQSGAAELGGIGAGISALSRGGLQQARQVAGADVSGIRSLLSGLGFSGIPGGGQRRTSALFKSIGFA